MIQPNFKFINNQDNFEKYLPDILRLQKCSLDVETQGLDVFQDDLLLLQIGNLDIQYIIDTRFVSILKLKDWLENPKVIKVGTNIVFDYIFLRHKNIQTEGVVDIYLIELMLHCGYVDFKTKDFFSLHGMCLRYLGINISKEERNSFINFRGDFIEKQLYYSARDVIYPLLILDKQKPKIIEHSLQRAVNLENNVLPSYGEIQYNGFFLNKDKWLKLIDYQKEQSDIHKKTLDNLFYKVCNLDLFDNPNVNYDSDDQLKGLIWKLGYQIPDTMHLSLLTLLPKEISEPIIKYREAQKAISSFGENFLNFINPVTSRLHAHIFQLGAVSGRNSFIRPALQTVKRENVYRNCFGVQNEDNIMYTIDMAGQEILIATEDSQEPLWLRLNKEGGNIHQFMGSNIIWNKPIDKKSSPKEYTITKNINFSLLYGAGIFKIMMFHNEVGIECDKEKAQSILDNIAKAIPFAWKALTNNGANSVINGYAESLIGFKRFFKNIPPFKVKEENGLLTILPKKYGDKEVQKILASIVREGRNHRIQSTGIAILKSTLVKTRQECKKQQLKFPMVHIVHDETVSEFTESKKDVYIPILEECMLDAEREILPSVIPKIESFLSKLWEK